MKNINWAIKLTSRKFWAAIVGVVVCSCAIFGVDVLTQEKATALIMAVATLISYIVGEGLVDAAAVKSETTETIETDSKEEE